MPAEQAPDFIRAQRQIANGVVNLQRLAAAS